jgi:hypothetical protein
MRPNLCSCTYLPECLEEALQHQLALPGSVASISDAFQRTLSIFTTLFAPQYVLRTVFRRSFRISDAAGRGQPVEKVGVELVATTNRVLKPPKNGVFGTRSRVKAAIRGVFQQAEVFPELRGLPSRDRFARAKRVAHPPGRG